MIRIHTGRPEFDGLYPKVRAFLEQDGLDVVIDGERIRGYRSPDARSIWIRDNSDMMRALRYFEPDMTSVVDHFADTQARNGRILDYFTTFPEKLPSERENWTKYVRVPVEADVEYRFVKAAYLAWQATGDDAWIRRRLPELEKALEYSRTHPWRWDPEHGLVKRAYTIDTWDFAYAPGHEWLQFQIDDDTFWGLHHGDNSGYVEAYRLLSRLYARAGDPDRARRWSERADTLQENLNRVCWNGRFYTHFVKLTPVTIPGVDEAAQLSLSNPMAINRGVASHEMAVSILGEYQRRRAERRAFAEWYSIDPPFPDGIFGDERLVGGAYVNGGILPLVGGELARAAFEHGLETYGVDILQRYYRLIETSGETYLWYHPDGTPSRAETSTSPDARPTDGWGSSAMLVALVEGLAGLEDLEARFAKVRLAPRWLAAGVTEAEVRAGYAASGAEVGYTYRRTGRGLEITVEGATRSVHAHVLLPEGTRARSVLVNGKPVDYMNHSVGESPYVDFDVSLEKAARLRIDL
ncbi:MAG: hypothetical protein JXQ29_00580 [Planctomycetes bacterium]|nr:hypothetical protein [Planctomycetota bacterium]